MPKKGNGIYVNEHRIKRNLLCTCAVSSDASREQEMELIQPTTLAINLIPESPFGAAF